MLTLTVKFGEVVRIGDAAAIKVLDKSGRRIKMAIATDIAPIEIIETGIIPPQFVPPGLKRDSRHERQPARMAG